MTHVYEVSLVGYTPEDWYVDETVGMFETIGQAERVAEELREMWPEDREGLVPTITEHELGRISDTNVAIALAEHALDTLIAESDHMGTIGSDDVEREIEGHSIGGAVADELRRAYGAYAC